MVVNDNAGNLTPRVVLKSIASELAPTEVACSLFHQKWKLVLSKAVRPAAWLAK